MVVEKRFKLISFQLQRTKNVASQTSDEFEKSTRTFAVSPPAINIMCHSDIAAVFAIVL